MSDPSRPDPSTAALAPLDMRREVAAAIARVLLLTVLLVVAYFHVPLTRDASPAGIVVFGFALTGFVVALVYEVRKIIDHRTPRLRAAQTIGTAIPVLIVLFALLYVVLSQSDRSSFTQPIDRPSGLYFATTVLTTTGFGDIAASSDV